MRRTTTVAQCAKLVRQDLKQLYPEVKFSVISQNYSMGNSVDVYYTETDLTQEEHQKLNEILRSKYMYGHFNGMEDIYEYSNTNEDIPQTKYLFLNSRRT